MGKRMTENEDTVIAALREISGKLDRIIGNLDNVNASLDHLCQCEDAKKREKLQKETAMQENIESMKRDMEKRRQEFAKKFDMPLNR